MNEPRHSTRLRLTVSSGVVELQMQIDHPVTVEDLDELLEYLAIYRKCLAKSEAAAALPSEPSPPDNAPDNAEDNGRQRKPR